MFPASKYLILLLPHILAKFPLIQVSYRSWKTWKVMEFMISISRPGKSCNSSEGRGKSWKSNMLIENKIVER